MIALKNDGMTLLCKNDFSNLFGWYKSWKYCHAPAPKSTGNTAIKGKEKPFSVWVITVNMAVFDGVHSFDGGVSFVVFVSLCSHSCCCSGSNEFQYSFFTMTMTVSFFCRKLSSRPLSTFLSGKDLQRM